jgi:hypothetical protein
MEKQLERLENKLDKMADDVVEIKLKMADDLTEIKLTMAKNTGGLLEHIKRTNILEKQVAPLWFTYKGIGAIIAITFVVAAVVEILSYFKK